MANSVVSAVTLYQNWRAERQFSSSQHPCWAAWANSSGSNLSGRRGHTSSCGHPQFKNKIFNLNGLQLSIKTERLAENSHKNLMQLYTPYEETLYSKKQRVKTWGKIFHWKKNKCLWGGGAGMKWKCRISYTPGYYLSELGSL